MVFDAETLPDWRAAEGRMVAGGRFRDKGFLEKGTAAGFTPSPGAHASEARIARFEPDRLVVRTRSEIPGILVLGEAWYPGWGATIGGNPAAAFPVNGWMRGVAVPPGANEVVLAYRPRLLAEGLLVTILSAAVIASLALCPRAGQTDSRIL
jgi:hypothetical protein